MNEFLDKGDFVSVRVYDVLIEGELGRLPGSVDEHWIILKGAVIYYVPVSIAIISKVLEDKA